MNTGQQSIYSRDSREWIPMTRHRAGNYTAPNGIHIGDGYMVGTNGYPVPMLRWVDANGNEKGRFIGGFEPTAAYAEGDRIEARLTDLAHVSVFYVRYNQINELLFDLNELVNTRTIGLRRNYVSGIGHANLSNLSKLENLDFSDNGSVTQITLHPDAPINFFYLGGTNINQANLDYILQHAIDSGILNGTLNYSGRPSYDAWANYDELANRGWNLSLAPVEGTVEKLGDTEAGASTGELIGGSHRVTFRAIGADGVTVLSSGAYSYVHQGDLPTFENNGWIETEYYHPAILDLKVEGKRLKTLYLSHLPSLQFGYFNDNNIQSVDISGISNLETLHLRNNPNFASINGIPNNPLLTDLDLRDTNLGSTAIDSIIVDLYNSGAINGIFQYSVKPNRAVLYEFDELIERGWTLSISPDRYAQVPSDPTNLRKLSSPANTLNYAWDASERAVYYEVRVWHYTPSWAIVEDGTYETTQLSGSLTGALENVQYQIEVTAHNSVGASNMVSLYTVAGATLAPSLEFSDIGLDSLTISWSGGEGTLDLYKQIDAGSQVVIQTFTTGSGTYTDTGLVPNKGYGYFFVARNAAGMKDWSKGINATVGKYYIDSVLGNDADDGKQASPWKTLSMLDTYDLPNGVEIYLQGGQTHIGNITAQQGLSYRAYGTGKAIVSAGNNTGFLATNISDIIVENIIFQGSGSGTNTGNGIHFINNQAGNTKLPNITINGCEVVGFKTYGIVLEGANVSSGFDNVTIDGCTVYDVLRGGITSFGQYDVNKTTYAHSNVHVSNCEVYNIHGDANITNTHSGNPIVLSDVQHSSITYCQAHDSAENCNWANGGAVGIWYWDADDVAIEHCEAYNMSSGLQNKDGGGFDLDGGVTNGKMRYNYSRNNDGGGYMVGQFGGRAMDNNLVAFNISHDDAKTNGAGIFLFSGATNMGNTTIMRNTIYQSTQTNKALDVLVWNGGNIGTVTVIDNVLYGAIVSTNMTMINNWNASSGLPQFVNPTAGNADGFKLQETSPLLDAGYPLLDYEVGTVDLFGNPVPKGEEGDIGAHEYPVPAPEAFTFTIDSVVENTINMSWTESKWAERYTIYFREQGTTVWEIEEPDLVKGTLSFSVSGERGVGTWEYYVRAYNNEGDTASNTDIATITVDNRWIWIGYGNSNTANFQMDKYLLSGNSDTMEIGVFPQTAGRYTDASGRTFITEPETLIASDLFSSTGGALGDFSFPMQEGIIAVRKVPTGVVAQEIVVGTANGFLHDWEFNEDIANPTDVLDFNSQFQTPLELFSGAYVTEIKALWVSFVNSNLSSTDVDKVIQLVDANGKSNGTLLLDGNAARTTASDTAYNSLVAKGWSFTDSIVEITTPTEGQDIQGDVTINFDIQLSTINIVTPTEGEDVTGDVNISFNLE